jgi:hypothetical protein
MTFSFVQGSGGAPQRQSCVLPPPQHQQTQPPPPPRRSLLNLLPFARIGLPGGGGRSDVNDPKFVNWLNSMAEEEGAANAAARAADFEAGAIGPSKHDNAYYAERCAFCAACRTAIDAEVGRRGARCAGCRRWFHARCDPRRQQQPADDGPPAHEQGGGSSGGKKQFFHSGDCQRVYQALQREAARGRRPLEARPAAGGLFGGFFDGLFGRGGSAAEVPEEEGLTVRLIDLGEAKRQYKSLQDTGMLYVRRQQLLEVAGLAAPALGSSSSGSGSEEGGDGGGSGPGEGGAGKQGARGARGALHRAGGGSPVDDFILAAELLMRQWPGDTVRGRLGMGLW